MNIKGLLEKDTLTVYEVKEIMNTVTEKCDVSMWTSVSAQIQEDIELGVDRVKAVLTTVQGLEERINKTLEESYENLEKQYDEISKKFALVNKRFGSLEIKLPNCTVPFQIKELTEMAERYANLTDTQKDAFIKLINAFKKNE